jgi:hypothetical protein
MAVAAKAEPATDARMCPECGSEIQHSHEHSQNDCCNDQWIRLQIERCYA